jgi:hypothetical protein
LPAGIVSRKCLPVANSLPYFDTATNTAVKVL